MKRGFWILMAMLLVSIAINFWQFSQQPKTETVIERDTILKDTTIYKPLPAETITTDRVVYIRIPVDHRDTIRDSIEIPVPIMQKRYDDSLYTAWISGYEPNLDSISLRLPEVQTTVTNTIVKPSPLITFGIQAGAGYGLINRRPDIYIGVGGQLNLWRR